MGPSPGTPGPRDLGIPATSGMPRTPGHPVPQDPMDPQDAQDLWIFRPRGTSGPQDPWEIASIV